MQISEAPISTIHGLTGKSVLGIAKDTRRRGSQPDLNHAAPAKAQISQAGTITEKNGNCRPTIAPSRYGSSR